MKKLSLVIILLFTYFNVVSANIKIVFVDMDKIISTSIPGASILTQLNIINLKNLKKFENQKNNLKKNEKKIISQKNILSEEEFQSNVDELKIQVNKYNEDRKKIITNFNNLKNSNTKNFLKMINVILTKYADEKRISIILNKKNLIIGKNELDITDEIIRIINKDITKFDIK